MIQTTPTRDEAVTTAMVNAAFNEAKTRRMTGLPNDFRAVLEAALASAPAPVSGRVDAVAELDAFYQGWLSRWRDQLASLSPASTTVSEAKGYEACRSNLADAWAAMRMIRKAVETLGPIGTMPAEEHLAGPTFLHEAEAIVAGIMKMKADQ